LTFEEKQLRSMQTSILTIIQLTYAIIESKEDREER